MSTRPDPDEELMNELRKILRRTDPVPPEVTEFAQAALGWRRLDADLAELLADSALDADRLALARGGDGRWLTFKADDLTIDVEIQADGHARTLLGQFAPPLAATVEVQSTDGTVVASSESDDLGRFRLTLEADGHVRLRVLREGTAPVETSWFTV